MEFHTISSCLFLSLWFFCPVVSSYKFAKFGPAAEVEDPYATHYYTRFAEVEKACKPVISSASNLEFDDNRANSVKTELSFVMGDWREDSGESPILPFNGNDVLRNSSEVSEPIYLATFTLMHFDPLSHGSNARNVSGALALGISWNGTAPIGGQLVSPDFRVWPGSSELVILFEGVYTETKENDREMVLCLLGRSKLPTRQLDPLKWATNSSSGNFVPPLVEDDNILLILRYPKIFMLTNRAVRGELKSLNDKSSDRYFDDVYLTSQLGAYSNYQFASGKLVSKACDHYPSQTETSYGKLEVYKGNRFCELLDRFVSGEVLSVVPNWNCNFTDEYCSKLGPFESNWDIKASDGSFANVGLMMQDVRCEHIINSNNSYYARVSAIFRAFPRLENHYFITQRSGLNGLTLSAEGIWNSSTGRLCMVGCRGLNEDGCQLRICLYIPTSYSIKQRSIIFGQISNINETESSFHPLTFEWPVHPFQLYNKFMNFLPPTYEYSKIVLAEAFLERSKPFDFSTIIKKSLLSYPKRGDISDEIVKLSNLADDLTLHVPAFPDPLPKNTVVKPFLQLEILTLGSLFGRYWTYQNASTLELSENSRGKASTTEEHLLLNVSAELTISEKQYSNFSTLYLEGLYNPVDGKMYLIGCRDVRASWKILFDSMDLENGLDCSIEVKVEYPPTTARWLMIPTAKVCITSNRNDDDPLYFSSIELQTLPILYQRQREDILSRRGVEGVLCIITLSLAIACISSQLFHISSSTTVVPYVSLVMLGVQALGYSIPLITGAEALFARNADDSYVNGFKKNQWYQATDYMVKVLVLTAFLLTLRLGQKVWKSRIRLLTRAPLEPRRVPSDRNVLLISCIIHFIGFVLVLIMHGINVSKRPINTEYYVDTRGNRHNINEWIVQFEEYIGLIQDFFLLPQIIGNFLWRIDCKPLRKVYYVGITVVRILPHIYDYIGAPVFNPYFSQEYEFVNPNLDFYSKLGDVAISIAATVFALILFIQQKWSYEKLCQGILSGQNKLMPLGSRVYERLPSMSVEAELVSGVNVVPMQDDPQ
ncbi:hypothetical protein HPP92_021805 [Vanilla planifolia]|uniref:RING-type E3 ubiquitin transferase n=1 Tax=Vanilla planifolia TaxID=51239 RepID=A0A835Q2R5_VANPL|nr:hypothetical protein HPP92_021805 [Vanilla planifolia]